jgi:anti-sigma regulatory factor (Ser/Thr protein kinase)
MAGAANADACDLSTGLIEQMTNALRHAVKNGFGAFVGQRGQAVFGQYVALPVDQGEGDFRAADVYADCQMTAHGIRRRRCIFFLSAGSSRVAAEVRREGHM